MSNIVVKCFTFVLTSLQSSLQNGKFTKLFPRLWLEGNLSITYGRDISNNSSEPFAVVFDPKEVEKALNIPCEDVCIHANTWLPGLFDSKPAQVVCFPFAQHLLSDSPGHFSFIKNEKELVEIMGKLDFDAMPKYSSKSLKNMFIAGQLTSAILIILLLILLFNK